MSLTKLSLAGNTDFSGSTNVANLNGQPLGIVMDGEVMRMVSSPESTNLVEGLSHEAVIG